MIIGINKQKCFFRDIVEVFVGARNPEKPEAIKLVIKSFHDRSYEEVLNMISHVQTKVHDDPSSASEIALNKAFWTIVGGTYYWHYFQKFVEIVSIIIRTLKDNGLETILEEMSKLFAEIRFFNELKLNVDPCESDDFLKKALQCLYFMAEYNLDYMKNVPRILEQIQALLESESVKNCKNPSLSRKLKKVLDWYMMEFLKLLSNHVADLKVGGKVNAIIPSVDEMIGTPLENDSNLSPVRRDSAYPSGPEYLDTYFRLLRTESFAKIQQGIKKLLSGELDERDMNVYYKIQVVGYAVTSRSLNVGVAFETIKTVR